MHRVLRSGINPVTRDAAMLFTAMLKDVVSVAEGVVAIPSVLLTKGLFKTKKEVLERLEHSILRPLMPSILLTCVSLLDVPAGVDNGESLRAGLKLLESLLCANINIEKPWEAEHRRGLLDRALSLCYEKDDPYAWPKWTKLRKKGVKSCTVEVFQRGKHMVDFWRRTVVEKADAAAAALAAKDASDNMKHAAMSCLDALEDMDMRLANAIRAKTKTSGDDDVEPEDPEGGDPEVETSPKAGGAQVKYSTKTYTSTILQWAVGGDPFLFEAAKGVFRRRVCHHESPYAIIEQCAAWGLDRMLRTSGSSASDRSSPSLQSMWSQQSAERLIAVLGMLLSDVAEAEGDARRKACWGARACVAQRIRELCVIFLTSHPVVRVKLDALDMLERVDLWYTDVPSSHLKSILRTKVNGYGELKDALRSGALDSLVRGRSDVAWLRAVASIGRKCTRAIAEDKPTRVVMSDAVERAFACVNEDDVKTLENDDLKRVLERLGFREKSQHVRMLPKKAGVGFDSNGLASKVTEFLSSESRVNLGGICERLLGVSGARGTPLSRPECFAAHEEEADGIWASLLCFLSPGIFGLSSKRAEEQIDTVYRAVRKRALLLGADTLGWKYLADAFAISLRADISLPRADKSPPYVVVSSSTGCIEIVANSDGPIGAWWKKTVWKQRVGDALCLEDETLADRPSTDVHYKKLCESTIMRQDAFIGEHKDAPGVLSYLEKEQLRQNSRDRLTGWARRRCTELLVVARVTSKITFKATFDEKTSVKFLEHLIDLCDKIWTRCNRGLSGDGADEFRTSEFGHALVQLRNECCDIVCDRSERNLEIPLDIGRKRLYAVLCTWYHSALNQPVIWDPEGDETPLNAPQEVVWREGVAWQNKWLPFASAEQEDFYDGERPKADCTMLREADYVNSDDVWSRIEHPALARAAVAKKLMQTLDVDIPNDATRIDCQHERQKAVEFLHVMMRCERLFEPVNFPSCGAKAIMNALMTQGTLHVKALELHKSVTKRVVQMKRGECGGAWKIHFVSETCATSSDGNQWPFSPWPVGREDMARTERIGASTIRGGLAPIVEGESAIPTWLSIRLNYVTAICDSNGHRFLGIGLRKLAEKSVKTVASNVLWMAMMAVADSSEAMRSNVKMLVKGALCLAIEEKPEVDILCGLEEHVSWTNPGPSAVLEIRQQIACFVFEQDAAFASHLVCAAVESIRNIRARYAERFSSPQRVIAELARVHLRVHDLVEAIRPIFDKLKLVADQPTAVLAAAVAAEELLRGEPALRSAHESPLYGLLQQPCNLNLIIRMHVIRGAELADLDQTRAIIRDMPDTNESCAAAFCALQRFALNAEREHDSRTNGRSILVMLTELVQKLSFRLLHVGSKDRGVLGKFAECYPWIVSRSIIYARQDSRLQVGSFGDYEATSTACESRALLGITLAIVLRSVLANLRSMVHGSKATVATKPMASPSAAGSQSLTSRQTQDGNRAPGASASQSRPLKQQLLVQRAKKQAMSGGSAAKSSRAKSIRSTGKKTVQRSTGKKSASRSAQRSASRSEKKRKQKEREVAHRDRRLVRLECEIGELVRDAKELSTSVENILDRWIKMMREIEKLSEPLSVKLFDTKSGRGVSVDAFVGSVGTALTRFIRTNMRTLRERTHVEEPTLQNCPQTQRRGPSMRCGGKCVCCVQRHVDASAAQDLSDSTKSDPMFDLIKNARIPTSETKRLESISNSTDDALHMLSVVSLSARGAFLYLPLHFVRILLTI